jgi:hypothetical protein
VSLTLYIVFEIWRLLFNYASFLFARGMFSRNARKAVPSLLCPG